MRQESLHQSVNPPPQPDPPSSARPQPNYTAPHVVLEERHLEDMVENIFDNEEEHSDEDCQCQEEAKDDETLLLDGLRTPLYEGADYSILRASLELLNLQVMYGWSNTSVDALLK